MFSKVRVDNFLGYFKVGRIFTNLHVHVALSLLLHHK